MLWPFNLLKDQYLLNPDVVFLNHGSFGACPKPVFEEYQNWQRRLENQPVQFMAADVYENLKIARDSLGNYVECNGDDLFFVQNPTTAVNTIIRSLDIPFGYEVLSTDHEYGSLIRAWEWFANEKGYEFNQREMPLPMISHREFVDVFWEGVTDRTKIIFLSQITSSTGLIFPTKEICRRARMAGIMTIIDGAHVPGHIPLNIRDMNPDVYTGACHKWLSAPKGSTFLYVKKELQNKIDPLIVSWGKDVDPSRVSFIHENQYQGTRDPSAFLTVPSAIKFQQDKDWDLVKARCRKLTRETRNRVYKIIDTDPICPNTEEWLGQMASVEIQVTNAESFKERLMSEFNIEIPVFKWKDRNLLRFSFNAYNDEKDADKLITALSSLLE